MTFSVYGSLQHTLFDFYFDLGSSSRSLFKAAIVLLPILGLTWVLGLFAVNENTTVFAWLFTIFNSLQVCASIRRWF